MSGPEPIPIWVSLWWNRASDPGQTPAWTDRWTDHTHSWPTFIVWKHRANVMYCFIFIYSKNVNKTRHVHGTFIYSIHHKLLFTIELTERFVLHLNYQTILIKYNSYLFHKNEYTGNRWSKILESGLKRRKSKIFPELQTTTTVFIHSQNNAMYA